MTLTSTPLPGRSLGDSPGDEVGAAIGVGAGQVHAPGAAIGGVGNLPSQKHMRIMKSGAKLWCGVGPPARPE